MEHNTELPSATRKRLVQLLQILKLWKDEKIKSVDISASTGWKPTLIRHDLWLIGFSKGVSNGYNVQELKTAIETAFGISEDAEQTSNKPSINRPSINEPSINEPSMEMWNANMAVKPRNCCIVGLGRLGAALLDENLVESPFVIKAGFDSNVNRVEILRSTFPLYPANEMQFVIKSEKISYAILTVQNKDAQQMADRLVKAGITGIVNMTNVMLKVPENIKVENISIFNALNLVI